MQPARLLTFGAIGIAFIALGGAAHGQAQKTKPPVRPAAPDRSSQARKDIADAQRDLIEKTKASKESLEKLRAVYEKQFESQSIDYQARKNLYDKDLISRLELEESERALNNTRFQLQQVRRWLAEDDIALSEALWREELARLPALGRGGYSENATFIRFNGGARWSLADAGKIEKFFSERFGRELPISALGQTPAHDRLGFDHRDALDVAVHPDSAEGRALLGYLRGAGIPFIAFRGKVAGSATGAHIHIGKPSLRVAAPLPARAPAR